MPHLKKYEYKLTLVNELKKDDNGNDYSVQFTLADPQCGAGTPPLFIVNLRNKGDKMVIHFHDINNKITLHIKPEGGIYKPRKILFDKTPNCCNPNYNDNRTERKWIATFENPCKREEPHGIPPTSQTTVTVTDWQ